MTAHGSLRLHWTGKWRAHPRVLRWALSNERSWAIPICLHTGLPGDRSVGSTRRRCDLGSAVGVIEFVEAAVFAGFDALYPGPVVDIPTDGCLQAAGEIHQRLPPSFPGELGIRQGIAAVMAGSIGDARNQAFWFSRGPQDALNDFEIRQRTVAADVVNFAVAALFQARREWRGNDRRRTASRGFACRRRKPATACPRGRSRSSAG